MLEQVRRLFGLTQEELAAQVGVSQNYYTQIETGSSKSAPLITKISNKLGIKELFLTSFGEYFEYPFLRDFYVLYLTEQRIVQSYKFLIDYICSKSSFVDVVFFLASRAQLRTRLVPSAAYIALRDDRDTIFLLKRRAKIRNYRRIGQPIETETESAVFPLLDLFREELHKMAYTCVHERTLRYPEELGRKIDDNLIERDDILPYFPPKDFFKASYEAHKKIMPR